MFLKLNDYTPTGCFVYCGCECIFSDSNTCLILIGIKGHSIDSGKGRSGRNGIVPSACVCVRACMLFLCGHASYFHLSFDHITAILTILMLVNE